MADDKKLTPQGRVVRLPDGRIRVGHGLSNTDGAHKVFHAPERVHEMNFGCRSCIHFDNGPRAMNLWHFKVNQQAALYQLKGKQPGEARQLALRTLQWICPPGGGICTPGYAGADFTTLASSCDRYAAREKPDGKLTMLPEEAKDKMGE